MPLSGTGERVTAVLDFPSRDGLSVQAIRVDYEPGGFTRGTHRHPAGAYVYVIDGSVEFVVGDGGPGVAAVAPGDEVFALTPFDRDGVAADYTAVPAELLAAKPRLFSRAESAAIPLPALTAWQGLFDHGRLAAGERVLIHGAAGAVGGLAVQLARTRDAYVVGSASAADLGLVRELGAQEAVDVATSFEDAVAPVDLVFDTVGGERLRRSGAVLRPGGRLVSVAEEPPDGGEYFTVEPNRDQLRSIARLAEAGELRRPSVEIFPPASAREAFPRSLERGRPRQGGF